MKEGGHREVSQNFQEVHLERQTEIFQAVKVGFQYVQKPDDRTQHIYGENTECPVQVDCGQRLVKLGKGTVGLFPPGKDSCCEVLFSPAGKIRTLLSKRPAPLYFISSS